MIVNLKNMQMHPKTIEIKSKTIFSFSETYMHLIKYKNNKEYFQQFLQQSDMKMMRKKEIAPVMLLLREFNMTTTQIEGFKNCFLFFFKSRRSRQA